MKAAILEDGRIHVGELPDPTPAQGQVVVRTHRCALCASDAHFLTSGHTIVQRSQKNNGPCARIDLSKSIVMGHEYVGKVDLRPWLGEGIGVSEVEAALKRMSDPSEPIRRVVDPSRLRLT
jgi:threonine dehydrogenase-like Zn-dependent dehydrogenase